MFTCNICNQQLDTSLRVNVGRNKCKPCENARLREKRKLDPEFKERRRLYRKKDYDKRRDIYIKEAAEWQKQNPEKAKKHAATSRKRNVKARLANTRHRQARLNQRTPKWLTKEELTAIRAFYKACPEGYHVDHIIPMNGKDVSGLHVLSNLQYLPAKLNLSKSNKF